MENLQHPDALVKKGEQCPQSDPSSAAAADSTSASTTQDSKSSGPARTTSRPEPSSTATGLPSLLPKTCERSTPDSLTSMCSPAGFPARISAKLAFVLALLSAPAPDSGTSSLAPFAYYDPESSLPRTSLDFSLPSHALPTDAYVAGLIDGEGCIYISKERKSFSLRVDTGMTAKALPLLKLLEEEYGGTVVRARAATDKWEAAYKWAISGAEAASMLRRLLPALLLKRPQAELALEMWDLREKLPMLGRDGRRRWTDEALASVAQMKTTMQELNRKGPAQPAAGTWVSSQTDLFSSLGSGPSQVTWPRSGTAFDGAASERQISALRTVASESSSLLPTPMANEGRAALEFDPQAYNASGRSLQTLALAIGRDGLLPTPVAKDDGKSPEAHRQMKANLPGGARTSITSLAVLARADFVQPAGPLLPTPTGDDANNVTRESGDFQSLAREANLLMPTPSSRDRKGKSARDPHRSDNGELRSDRERPLSDLEDLLPTGESTQPPLRGGKNSPDPLPDQLTIGDA